MNNVITSYPGRLPYMEEDFVIRRCDFFGNTEGYEDEKVPADVAEKICIALANGVMKNFYKLLYHDPETGAFYRIDLHEPMLRRGQNEKQVVRKSNRPYTVRNPSADGRTVRFIPHVNKAERSNNRR